MAFGREEIGHPLGCGETLEQRLQHGADGGRVIGVHPVVQDPGQSVQALPRIFRQRGSVLGNLAEISQLATQRVSRVAIERLRAGMGMTRCCDGIGSDILTVRSRWWASVRP